MPLNHTQWKITLELDVIDNAILALLYSLFHLQSIFGEGGKRSLLDLLFEVEKSSKLKISPSVFLWICDQVSTTEHFVGILQNSVEECFTESFRAVKLLPQFGTVSVILYLRAKKNFPLWFPYLRTNSNENFIDGLHVMFINSYGFQASWYSVR